MQWYSLVIAEFRRIILIVNEADADSYRASDIYDVRKYLIIKRIFMIYEAEWSHQDTISKALIIQ